MQRFYLPSRRPVKAGKPVWMMRWKSGCRRIQRC